MFMDATSGKVTNVKTFRNSNSNVITNNNSKASNKYSRPYSVIRSMQFAQLFDPTGRQHSITIGFIKKSTEKIDVANRSTVAEILSKR